MSTESDFIQAIVEHPDDDACRLRYADWCDQQGSSRGEFIRLQLEMHQHREHSIEYRDALADALKLFIASYDQWDQGLRWGIPAAGTERPSAITSARYPIEHYRRGCADLVRAVDRTFIKEFPKTFDLAPIKRATILVQESPAALFSVAELCELTSIELKSECNFDINDLAESDNLGHLADLTFHFDLDVNSELSVQQCKRLANQPALQHLKRLRLSGSQLPIEGLQALLNSPVMTKLTELELSFCGLDDDGLIAILESDSAQRLTKLALIEYSRSTGFTDRSIDALMKSQLPSLRELSIAPISCSDQTYCQLVQSPLMRQLVYLHLTYADYMCDARIDAIVESPNLVNLRGLYLGDYIDDGAICRLAEATNMPQVNHLDLGGNGSSTSSVALLADRPIMKNVTKLAMHGKKVASDDDLQSLANAKYFGQNRHLRLAKGVTSNGLKILFSSPTFARVSDLSLVGVAIDEDTARYIANAENSDQLRKFRLDDCELSGNARVCLEERFGRYLEIEESDSEMLKLFKSLM